MFDCHFDQKWYTFCNLSVLKKDMESLSLQNKFNNCQIKTHLTKKKHFFYIVFYNLLQINVIRRIPYSCFQFNVNKSKKHPIYFAFFSFNLIYIKLFLDFFDDEGVSSPSLSRGRFPPSPSRFPSPCCRGGPELSERVAIVSRGVGIK